MKFSVIVPAYQSASFIGQALSSALDQTLPPHEIVVVDDGSTDGLDEAVAPYRSSIVYLRQPNRGPGAARNLALHRATGDWVVFLDADDWWELNRLDEMRRHAESHPDHSVITTDAMLAGDAPPVRYYSGVDFAHDGQREAILSRNFIFISAAVPRSLVLELGGFSEERPLCEDWDLWVRVILSGRTAGLVEEPLAYYRVHGASATCKRSAVHRGDVAVLRRALERGDLSPRERRIARGRQAVALFDEASVGGASVRRPGLDVARSSTLSLRMRLAGATATVSPALSKLISQRS